MVPDVARSRKRQRARLIARIALRLHCTPDEVRAMRYTDFLAVVAEIEGKPVPMDADQIAEEFRRLGNGEKTGP